MTNILRAYYIKALDPMDCDQVLCHEKSSEFYRIFFVSIIAAAAAILFAVSAAA